MNSFRSLARNHDFTVLWTGELVSQLGSQMSLFVFPLIGYALTGSAALAGLVPGAFVLGMTLALLPAGVFADRLDRRRVLQAASGSGALLHLSLAVAGLLGWLTFEHLLVVALFTGVGTAVFGPAEMSAVRTVVSEEELPTALSQNQARQHVGALLGAPLGGLLYGLGRAVPFCFDTVSYLVSFLAVSRLRTDLSPQCDAARPHRRPWQDLTAGLRYVAARPYFRAMMAFAATSNLMVNAVFFVATMRLVQQGVPALTIGIVSALAGAGGIIGAILAPTLIRRLRTGHLVLAVAWSWVPLTVPLLFWCSPALVGTLLFLGLLLNPAGNAGSQSYRMAITPADLQGRIGSATQFVGMSVMPLAGVLGGLLLDHYGPIAATLALLVGCAGSALVPTLARTVRTIPRPAEWAVATAVDSAPESVPAG